MHYCDYCPDCDCGLLCPAYCEECGCDCEYKTPDTNKPPAPGLRPRRTYPAMRGDEREDSTSTERQSLSRFRHSGLSFAAKHRIRESYPAYTCTPSPLARVCRTYCRPRARSASVLRRRLPPHSAGLRPALHTNIHTRPEGSQAGCLMTSRTSRTSC